MSVGDVIFNGLALVLLFLASRCKCEETYDIPITINALIQESVKIGSTAKLFYNMDKDFYSKVTVTDAARNAEQPVRDTIQKTIKVVFLTVASSHVSKTLTLSNLLYTTKSKWSYTVDVKDILEASQGGLTAIDDKTIIYKIQENAMKVLEERFQFQNNEILNRLNLELLDYFAVDEAKWIEIVGIIVEKVISNRSKTLQLTTCYLAELVNKTVHEIQGLTLNEADMYLYNTTMLLEKLPNYRNDVLSRLYQIFDIDATELSKISNRNLSEINSMTLNDVLQLFTQSVLRKLRVIVNEIVEKDSSFDADMLLSCTDKWEAFKTILIPESFHNSAEAMAIEVETLSALVNIPVSEIQNLTITEMINLLETTIDPLSAEKKLVEATTLSSVLQLYRPDKIDNKKDNVFDIIYRFTNVTERQLTILYGWTSEDYTFSFMFTLENTNDVCAINSLDYDLLALAKLTIGQVGDIPCQSFNVLREIWNRKSVDYLEYKYSSDKQLSLDTPVSTLVSQLTNAPSNINNRVLNTTSEAAELISKLSINNITEVTTYSNKQLQAMSFQEIIGIIVHLKRNGSFDHEIQVTSRIENSMASSMHSTTPLTTTSMLTTKPIIIPDKITSSKKAVPTIQALTLSTMNVFFTSTVTLNEELSTEKLSTNSNQPTSTIRAVVVSPSPNMSSSSLPTPLIPSRPSKVLTTLLETSMTSLVKPSTTKSTATSSSIEKPALTCQPECKAGELCILNIVTPDCKAAQNLEGNFRITGGANFTDDLQHKNSKAFQTLASPIQKMIDSLYKSSQYSSNYLGAQVLRFEQGSIVVFFKISFENTLTLSADTVEDLTQVFGNFNDTSFTVDTSSFSLKDFDECSSAQATKCYKTATCNNTLGSFVCICPDGMTGDGISCQVVNSARSEDKEEVPWIIYVVIAIMVVLIIFLIVVIIYCEKKHKKKYRPQVLDLYSGGINMYPRSTSYLAQTPESEADLADGLGIVNRHGPPPNMVTFNPTPEDKKELELQKGQPGVFQYRL